jgi:hypothetical protein
MTRAPAEAGRNTKSAAGNNKSNSKEQVAGSKVKIVVSYFAICSLLFAI